MWTILAAFFLIAFFTAFLLLIVRLNNKDKNREHAELVNRFRQLAKDHDLCMIDEEIMDNLAIGLDDEKRKFLVLKRLSRNNYESAVVDLNEVTSSEKREVYGRVYPERYATLKDLMQLEKIVLELEFEDERKPLQISFYDFIENSDHEIGEMKKKARRWETLLFNLKRSQERKRA